MKFVSLLALMMVLVLSSTLAPSISHDDLIKLIKRYLTEMDSTIDVSKFESCVDDGVGTMWEKMMIEIKRKPLKDFVEIMQAFAITAQSSISILGELYPCGSKEIGEMHKKIIALINDEKEFNRKVHDNIDIIAVSLQALIDNWDRADFESAGKTIGGLIFWIFLN